MVRIDKAIIARLKKEGEVFEVLVDCDKALEFRAGKIDSLDEVLATREIYKDVKQGEHASENDIKKVFLTENPLEVAATIIKEGEIQLTTEHKNNLREEKKKQIVQMIHRNAIDPKTGNPIPIETLEMVMEEMKIRIDEFKTPEAQIDGIITNMRPKIPIKLETREIEIVIPSKFTGPAIGILKRLGKLLKQDWLDDGSLKALLEIPAGIQEEIELELNKMTKGDFQLKILNKN